MSFYAVAIDNIFEIYQIFSDFILVSQAGNLFQSWILASQSFDDDWQIVLFPDSPINNGIDTRGNFLGDLIAC